MTKELATFTPYSPPYWQKRAWNPAGHNSWERKILVALEHGSQDLIDKLLTQRERQTRWREPYGKTRAFALDYPADIIDGKRLVRLALTPQKLFQQWRAEIPKVEEEYYPSYWEQMWGVENDRRASHPNNEKEINV